MGFLNILRMFSDSGNNEVKQSNIGYPSGGLGMSSSGAIPSFHTTSDWMPSADLETLGVATALRCIAVIADSVAQTPFNLYKKDGRTVIKGADHSLSKLLTYSPNKWMDVNEFWQMFGLRTALQGEIVVWKVKALGKIVQLVPFPIDKVTIYSDYVDGWEKRVYSLQKDDGTYIDVPEEDIWHFKKLNFWRRTGLATDYLSYQAISLALKEQDFMKNFMENGVSPSGVITADQALNDEQYKIAYEHLRQHSAGASNSGKILLLSNNFKYQSTNVTNSDAQFVENRDLLISDICRFWGVPPYMVYHYKNNVSYSSSEHATLSFISNTLAPLYRAIEKSAERHLLSYEDFSKGFYFKFNEKALLRTDAKTQLEVIQGKVNTGVYTINEARALEDYPPVDGGDVSLVQGAMIKLTDVGAAYGNIGENNNITDENNEGAGTSSEQTSEEE